jgi:glycerophosphoryl diester phosphodiesterase
VSKLKKILPDFQIIWIVEYGYNVSIEKKMYLNVYNKIEAANLDGISTYADLSHCIRMAKDIIERKWIWNVWTVDNPCLAKQFKSFGVTSLSSNRPDWIIKHL